MASVALLGGLFGGQDAGGSTQNATAPGLTSPLDLNGDGNPLDNIMQMAGKGMR